MRHYRPQPVVRIVTDQGISGYGEAETAKPYLKPMVLFYKNYLLGEDPTDVNRIMLKIRRMGASKPWGSAVSAIEIALWDVAGQAAGLPVYKLLGGKIRDRVRPYGNSEQTHMTPRTPQDYAELASEVKEAKEGYTLIKLPVGFHNDAMLEAIPDAWYGRHWTGKMPPYMDRGMLTQPGIDHVIACVEAAKKAVGNDIGLAFDCGPGWTVKDAIRLARAVEPYDLAWLEDLITGDYTPYPNAQVFKEVTDSTSTRIHTGEEIYLRENFKDLIETQAVNVLGPDPEDVGGIAELKWIAEYANLHGIQVAPHGISTDCLAWPRKCIWEQSARRTILLSNTPRPSRSGGVTLWTACPIRLSRTASSTFGTRRDSASPSMSVQPKRTFPMRIAISLTETELGPRACRSAVADAQARPPKFSADDKCRGINMQ